MWGVVRRFTFKKLFFVLVIAPNCRVQSHFCDIITVLMCSGALEIVLQVIVALASIYPIGNMRLWRVE